MSKHIAVDIDGTLCETYKHFLYYLNREYDQFFVLEDIKDAHFFGRIAQQFGEQTIQEMFNEFLMQENTFIGPFEGAKSMLERIKEKGHQVSVLTARSCNVKEVTLQWIETYFGNTFFDDIIFLQEYDAQEFPTKGQLCKYLEVDVLVDDTKEHLIACNALQIQTIVVDHSWNEDVKGEYVVRVHHWDELENALKKLCNC